MKQKLLYLFLLILTISACRKDINDFSVDIDEEPPIILIESTIRGKVINELGLPVANALVKIGDKSTNSDQNGSFMFTQTEVKKSGDIVTASINNHFEGVSHANFTAEGSAYVQITVVERSNPDVIDPTILQEISKPSGLKITIPPGSIVSSNGGLYNGPVKVHSRWIDPTDENLGSLMPGALNAIDENGDNKVLATYGMVVLDLETEFGETLDIKQDSKVTVEVPIPADILGGVPEEIPLWQYDLEEGQWLQNGICYKNGNVYICDIPSTGYWNCDKPLEAICLSGQVFNADSTFASYLKVIVEDLTDNFIYWGYTDSIGYFCGSVPRAAPLKITIKDHCDNIVYMEEIGPYSMDFQLEDIYLDDNIDEFLVNISGSMSHCISTDVPQGHLAVRYPGTLKIFPFDNGEINVNLALKCIDFPEIALTAHSTTEAESTVSTITTTNTDVTLGLQLSCESLIDSFGLLIDGINYFTSPTQYYLEPNQTTNWMVLEGLSGAGTFTLELRNYQGVGLYEENVFFKTENEILLPNFDILDAASPDILVNITFDDGEFIIGDYSGSALDSNNNSRNISGNFKIKKAP